MSRYPSALALLGVLALVAASPAVAATTATGPEPALEHPSATAQQPVSGPGDAAARLADDDINVTVETPRIVAANVTLEYALDVTGANGSVNATWRFPDATKHGTTVEHRFEEDRNATIVVTVTDEAGASVTRGVTVQVVEYGSEDEDSSMNPERFVGTVAIAFVVLGLFPAVLYLVVLPRAMEHFWDAFE